MKKITREMTSRGIEYMVSVLRCQYYAYEFGKYCSDLICIDAYNRLIEIEIKSSKQDIIADFDKLKHQVYAVPENHDEFCPCYFLFLIPTWLEEYTVNAAEGTPYGVIVYNNIKKPNLSIHRRMRVAKSPKIIKNGEAHEMLKSRMIDSDIYRLRE